MNKNKPTERSREITQRYFSLLDKHLAEIVSGQADEMLKLNQIASELSISHTHLSDTIQQTTGHSPCYFYDLKIIEQAKMLLTTTDRSVSEIAWLLTYDPSNFSKFFKKLTGQTPGNYRDEQKTNRSHLPKSSPL